MELSTTLGRNRKSSLRKQGSSNKLGSDSIAEEEDDVLQLQWAAIERLPTFKRLRTSLFDAAAANDQVNGGGTSTNGNHEFEGKKLVTDVTKLGGVEKRLFIEKLIKHIENDNLKLLQKLKERIDRVNVKLPTVEVRYKDLIVEAECEIVRGKPLPTLWNSLTNPFSVFKRAIKSKSEETKISILKVVSGIIKPSRLTLLLGPPGCGKTTLLLALAGKLDPSLKVTGEISYNGYSLDEFVPKKTSAYISQYDLHIPEMTVRETIDFSARCQGVGNRADIMMEVSRKEKEAGIVPDPDVDTYMKAISVEGQKTNLQTDYVLKILGLDICADIMVGSALERGISGGQKKRLTTGEMIVGPTKALFMDEISTGLDSSTTFQIITYLQQMVHITDATALVSLLQPAPETFNLFDDVILMADGKIVYHGPCGHVLQYFEDCGFKCPERKGVADFLQEVTSKKDQAQYWCRADVPYTCMGREMLLMKRNSFVYVFKTVQLLITAFITMTVFIRTEMKVDLIHANYLMGSTTYYVIGFSPEIQRFFCQFLVLFGLHLASTSLCRFLASIFKTMVVATTVGTLILIMMFLCGGFIIPRFSLPPWLKWAFWISPMAYGEIGISLNEFLAPRWQKASEGNTTTGRNILISHGLNFDGYFYWISFLALIGFTILFDFGFILALTYLKPPKMSRAIISKKKFSEIQGRDDRSNKAKLDNESTRQKGRMVLPFEPQTITFTHVQYFVDTPPEMRKRGFNEKKLQLLHDITGSFRPGILTALMGITVEESVTFSAWLRLPSNIGSDTKARFVAEVIETIELDDIKDSLVGVPGQSGLSTEQRKRLTIAVELVSNPSIIFMDEPTSGLDARAAAIVMRAVKNVVSTGRTTVCTIHQPSIDVFEAFDELILMKTGGRIIYSGMLGHHSSKLIEYFEGISSVPKIKANYNPATWMLEVTSASMEAQLGVDFANIYEESPLYQFTRELVRQFSEPQPGSRDLHFPTRFPQSTRMQFMACLWKQHLSYWRSPEYNFTRLVSMICSAIMFGLLFWQKGKEINNEQDLFIIMGSMYIAVIFLGINNCSSILPYVATERNVLYREYFAGMYSPWAYAFAQVTIEVPYILVQAIIYVAITYPMIGYYWSVYKVFWFFYATFCTFLYFVYLGMVMVSLCSSLEIASILATAIYTILNLFSGFLIPGPKIPKWWIWCYWICPTAWSLNGLLTSQYGDMNKEILIFGEQKTVSSFLQDYYGFHNDHLGIVAAVLIVFPVAFASLFAYCIGKLNFQRR
ncbi:hypothetical protein LWI29_015832 [Acer saccharum]|uniref:ABC transporter domain-containing protein n=1 Tax=Acer saccharum TaxID=4024 RepID=A0AA39W8J3_ACESA|nr:hypothetical protein LWI29_015832 [Acer saccharum]